MWLASGIPEDIDYLCSQWFSFHLGCGYAQKKTTKKNKQTKKNNLIHGNCLVLGSFMCMQRLHVKSCSAVCVVHVDLLFLLQCYCC